METTQAVEIATAAHASGEADPRPVTPPAPITEALTHDELGTNTEYGGLGWTKRHHPRLKGRWFHEPQHTGTFAFPSGSQWALWEHELTGQISDGQWENSGPREHHAFWCHLETKLDTGIPAPHVRTRHPSYCNRTYYGFRSLLSELGDRMLNLGRLGRAWFSVFGSMDGFGYEQRVAAGDMPETRPFGLIQRATVTRFAEAISDEVLHRYYDISYTRKDLLADLKAISEAMKALKP